MTKNILHKKCPHGSLALFNIPEGIYFLQHDFQVIQVVRIDGVERQIAVGDGVGVVGVVAIAVVVVVVVVDIDVGVDVVIDIVDVAVFSGVQCSPFGTAIHAMLFAVWGVACCALSVYCAFEI